jgi:hypothetical protein
LVICILIVLLKILFPFLRSVVSFLFLYFLR